MCPIRRPFISTHFNTASADLAIEFNKFLRNPTQFSPLYLDAIGTVDNRKCGHFVHQSRQFETRKPLATIGKHGIRIDPGRPAGDNEGSGPQPPIDRYANHLTVIDARQLSDKLGDFFGIHQITAEPQDVAQPALKGEREPGADAAEIAGTEKAVRAYCRGIIRINK